MLAHKISPDLAAAKLLLEKTTKKIVNRQNRMGNIFCLIEKKINLNNNLLETIKVLRQDENNLKDENDAYEIALKLIKKRLKEEYRR